MTIAVDLGRKATKQHTNYLFLCCHLTVYVINRFILFAISATLENKKVSEQTTIVITSW